MTGDQTEVFLIEDNPGDVRLIEEMLGESSAHDGGEIAPVRHADRLDDGLAQLDEAAVDVVLLDLGLPDSSGIETLETLRSREPEVPVVVLTGLDDETVGDQAVQRGAQEYLVKDELTPRLLGRSIRHAIERKRFDRTQAALHRASREFIHAESDVEASQLAVDTAVDVLGLPGILIYLFNDEANELRPAAATAAGTDIFGEIPSFGAGDASITWRTFIDGETAAIDDVHEREDAYRQDTPLQSGLWIPLGDHGVIIIVSEAVGGFDQQTQRLADHLAATTEATLDRIAREQSLREHQRELTERNRQLEALNRMNGVIREIDQALVQATTREAIERAVCELLTQADRFAFAWIGQSADDRVAPRTWAGADQGYLDAVSLTTDDGGPPAVTTATTGTVTLVPNVAADLRAAPWRTAALGRDLGSAISVPLTYAEVSYGVLTIFATDPNAFDERTEVMFVELGETIANAMNAVDTRRALVTDTVVELELAIRDPDAVLDRLARETDCRIEYTGFVPQSEGTDRLFFTATGASASELGAAAADVPSVRRLDCISEADDGDDAGESRFEMTVMEPTIASRLVDCGVRTRSITVTSSETRVVVELPGTTDVRTFIDRLEATYPDTELLARRDKERDDQWGQTVETPLAGELTERQLETLTTAYHSGYFEWPRDRTGEEVAESLGITQPTFNGHLRAAERKLCELFLDGPPPSGD